MKLCYLFLFYPILLFSALNPFRVGMELSYPPFEMICQDGKPCGISVDMVKAFGE